MEQQYLIDLAKKTLSEKRFNHTVNVSKLAVKLAEKYDCDFKSTYTAALLHDITKEKPNEMQLQTIINSDIIVTDVVKHNPSLFHGLTAFLFAKENLAINNNDILNAIRYHTTGRVGMSLLEKIVYVADATSYERKYDKCDNLRRLAFIDIDKSVLEIAKFTIDKIIKENKLLAIETVECYNDFVLCQHKGE